MNLTRDLIEEGKYTSVGDVIREALSKYLNDPTGPLEREMENFEEVRQRLHNRVQSLKEKTEKIAKKD